MISEGSCDTEDGVILFMLYLTNISIITLYALQYCAAIYICIHTFDICPDDFIAVSSILPAVFISHHL